MIDRITINSYHNKLASSVLCEFSYNGYYFYDNSNDFKMFLKADEKINIGINTNFNRIGGALQFSIFRSIDSNTNESKSLFFILENYRINKYIYLSISYNKGFCWKPENFLLSVQDYKPDVKSFQVSGRLLQWTNKSKYSYNAFLSLNEWQRHSSGSFIAGFHFFISTLFSGSSLFPESVEGSFNNLYSVRGLIIMDLSVQLGYSHIFVFGKHFFFGVLATTSLSMQFLEAWSNNESLIEGAMDFYLPLNVKSIAGYNGNSNSFGVTFTDENCAFRLFRNTPVHYSIREISVFYNHRLKFSFPKKIRISSKAFFSKKKKKIIPNEKQ